MLLDDGQGVHARAQALDVDPDDVAAMRHPGSGQTRLLDDVRVGHDERLASPPLGDLRRGAGGERDEGVRRLDEDPELRVVQLALVVVRVAQVVHGQHEGLAVAAQARGDPGEVVG